MLPLLTENDKDFNILVIAQHSATLETLSNNLSHYTVTHITDSLDALREIEKAIPDLILLEAMMPNLSGYEVICRLRKDWNPDQLPILLLVDSHQLEAVFIRALDSGANDCLSQSISKPELLARIRPYLQLKILQQKASKVAQENEQQLYKFLEAIPIGIGVFEKSGKAYYFNQLAKQLLGKDTTGLDVTINDFSQTYQLYIAGTQQLYPNHKLTSVCALEGLKNRIDDIEIHHPDKIIPIESHGAPIFDEANQITHAIIAFQEIRPRAETNQMREIQAEAVNRIKNRFLAHISHELRTPLNPILGYADFLKRQVVFSKRQQNALNIIEESGQHLLSLINDILDLSHIEAQQLVLTPSAIDLPAFLENIVGMMQIHAQEKPIILRYETSNTLPSGVEADESRLRQVLLNLLGNAIKFTETGNVIFRVYTQSTLEKEKIKICFEVHDTGPGIAPIDQARIFQPFEQIHLTIQHNGVGLGLSISQQLVKLMGSRIEVKSTLGQGSCFVFELELPLTFPLVKKENEQKKQKITGYQGKSRQLLVVDDHPNNRKLLEDWLILLGFQVETAQNGREAIEQIHSKPFDLVFMDIIMPGIDGFTTTQRIRSTVADGAQLPIIAISASPLNSNQRNLFNGFLEKPVKPCALQACLKKQLDLDWIYQQTIVDKEKVKNPPPLIVPPMAELETLYELVTLGMTVEIEAWAEAMVVLDSSYVAFTDKVLAFNKKFEKTKLLALLEEVGLQTSDH
jgi:signal transduction histidine kinase